MTINIQAPGNVALPATSAQIAQIKSDLQVPTLVAGTNVTITGTPSAPVINATGGTGGGGTPFETAFSTTIQYDKNYRNVSTPYTVTGPLTFTRDTTGAAQGNEMLFSIIHDGVSAITLTGLLSNGNLPLGVDMTSISEVGRTYVISAFLDSGGYCYGARRGALVTSLPTAPLALTKGTATTTTQPLSWTVPASAGTSPITDYLVEYKLTSSGTWLTFADGTSTATSATVTGLTPSTSYDYRVSAITAVGTGPASTPTTGSTATPATGSLTRALGTVPGSAILTASDGSNNWIWLSDNTAPLLSWDTKLTPSLGYIVPSETNMPVVFAASLPSFPGITSTGADRSSTTNGGLSYSGAGSAISANPNCRIGGGGTAGVPSTFQHVIPVDTTPRVIDFYFQANTTGSDVVTITAVLADGSATMSPYVCTQSSNAQRLTINCTAGSATTLTLKISNANIAGTGSISGGFVMVS